MKEGQTGRDRIRTCNPSRGDRFQGGFLTTRTSSRVYHFGYYTCFCITPTSFYQHKRPLRRIDI